MKRPHAQALLALLALGGLSAPSCTPTPAAAPRAVARTAPPAAWPRPRHVKARPVVVVGAGERARPPGGRGAPQPASARTMRWRRGVSLGLFSSAATVAAQRRDYARLLDEIVAIGATDVSIVVRWAQARVDGDAITPAPGVTTPDALVGWVLDAAHARGLRTFLLPIIQLQQLAPGVWRGTLRPADRAAWWRSYEAFILHHARLAAQHHVELFAVGSELLSMERDAQRWRALIRAVRAVAPGVRLTYSANWDHYEHVPFWDDLDVVGVTGYYELAPRPGTVQADALVEAWHTARWRLALWAGLHGRDFVFTEIGYPSSAHGAARPWDHGTRSAPAHQLQAACYEAMRQVWSQDPDLAGLYVWNWFGTGAPNDTGYSPRGKPAAQVLRRWFRAPHE